MRHVQLSIFCLLTMASGMAWVTFAPVATSLMAFYGVSPTAINWLSMCYMVLYVPGCTVASAVLDSLGLRTCLLVGALLTAFGALVRLAGVLHFAVLMGGQCLMALAQCFLLAVPPVLAVRWYPSGQRDAATSVAITCNYAGVALSYLIPLLVTERNFAVGYPAVLGVQAAVCALGAVLALLLVRSRPPLPPSPIARPGQEGGGGGGGLGSAEVEGVGDEDCAAATVHSRCTRQWRGRGWRWLTMLPRGTVRAMLLQWRMLWSAARTNRQFLLLATSFGIVQGVSYAYSSLLEQIAVPLGFTQAESGVFGLAIIVSGILCSAAVGCVMDRTRRYSHALKFGFLGLALSTALLSVSIAFSDALRSVGMHMVSMVVSCVLFGSFSMGIMPVCIILGVEITYVLSL